MLAEFHLRNFVLFEAASLRFGPAFNVISGETGAGKSLLAQALSTVLGRQRFETRFIRKGCDSASLTLILDLPARRRQALARTLEMDLDPGAEEGLHIERTAVREGRSRSLVNGRPVPLATLRTLGEALVEICAQDEPTSLRDPACQRLLLDRYGRLGAALTPVEKAWNELRSLVERQEGGAALRRARQAELERVRHFVAELDAIGPDAEADGALDERIAFLENAARLRAYCGTAVEELHEADESITGRVGGLRHGAADFEDYTPALREVGALLDGALTQIDEAARLLRDLGDETDVDQTDLEATLERRHALQDLARKHQVEVSDLASVQTRLQQQETELRHWEADAEELGPRIAQAAAAYHAAARALRQKREKAGRKLSRAIAGRLHRLGMDQARFAIEINALDAEAASGPDLVRVGGPAGLDEVAFRLQANPGETWGALVDTASGGETARVMLALKSALAEAQTQDTLFFDEIDAGIGGRLGEVVAEQFTELARSRQVIAITHLPQIASHGDTHLCVERQTQGGRTRTRVLTLDGEARIGEIASMIRGERSTATTREQARELLGDRCP